MTCDGICWCISPTSKYEVKDIVNGKWIYKIKSFTIRVRLALRNGKIISVIHSRVKIIHVAHNTIKFMFFFLVKVLIISTDFLTDFQCFYTIEKSFYFCQMIFNNHILLYFFELLKMLNLFRYSNCF